MGKTRNQWEKSKRLSELYQQNQEPMSFTEFKKKMGIKKGRPRKTNKHNNK